MGKWSPDPGGDSEEDTADRDEFMRMRDAKQPPITGRTQHFHSGLNDAWDQVEDEDMAAHISSENAKKSKPQSEYAQRKAQKESAASWANDDGEGNPYDG